MNLTALSFAIQFIHSFIPLHMHRTSEKETAQSKRIVIEIFFFVQSSPPSLLLFDPMSLWKEKE
jgi:hypothetical protein